MRSRQMRGTFPLAFSVTSGKGGVGKTNLSVNLALCLAQLNKRVALIDADLGLANVDVLLGLTPQKNLFHLFHEGASLREILFPTPYGFSILPASSGVSEMLTLSTGQKLELLEAVGELEDELDYLIVDTGAGISDNVLYFNLAAQERLVVLTPEPASLTDAYALIKMLKLTHGVEHFKVCVNMTPALGTVRAVLARLYQACDSLPGGVSLDLAGVIPLDEAVREAAARQLPFYVRDPRSPASRAVLRLAENILAWDVPENPDGNIKFFWKPLLCGAGRRGEEKPTPRMRKENTGEPPLGTADVRRMWPNARKAFESGFTAWEDFSPAEREVVARHYAPRIRPLALRLKARLPFHVELDELLGAGALGLVEALCNFRPERGVCFERYAENRIRGAMLDELRRQDWLPRSLRRAMRRLDEARRIVERGRGRPATEEELLSMTGLEPRTLRYAMEALEARQLFSLDAIQDSLAADGPGGADEPCHTAAMRELAEHMERLLARLTPREKMVLSLYYTDGLTMREAAEVMSITECRVSQLHAQALARLRTYLGSLYENATPIAAG